MDTTKSDNPLFQEPIRKSYDNNHHAITPWGGADYCYTYPCGIKFYGTPRHGGFFVPKNLRQCLLPYDINAMDKSWYEEDCEGLKVYLAFPELVRYQDDIQNIKTSYERCFDSKGIYKHFR